MDDAFSGQCLSFMGPNSVRNGSLVMSAGGPGPDAYWPCDLELKVQVSRTPEKGSCQSVAPVTVEPGTRVLRPAGLSSAERISDSLRVWGLRGLDATTPVATRTSHSWEQIIGL